MQNKLSVIIPTHNDGSKLKRAVQSALQSPLSNIEVIVVDDGSDVSVSKVLKIEDIRLHVYRQRNGGVSKARNVGLEHSTGEYVLFLDADDELTPNWSECLSDPFEEDIVVFNYLANYSRVTNIDSDRILIGHDLENYVVEMIKNPTKNLTVWGKFLKRSIIDRFQLQFNEQLAFAEDGDFMIRFLLKSHSANLMGRFLYRHYFDSTSVMSVYSTHKMAEYLKALVVTQRHIIGEPKSIQDAYAVYIAMHLNIVMVHQVFSRQNGDSFKAKVSTLKETLANKIISDALQSIALHNCNRIRLLPIAMIKIHAYWAAGLLYAARAIQAQKRIVN